MKEKQKTVEKEKDPYKRYKALKWDAKEYINGPFSDEKRKCHDCCCCIFFILFLCGIVVISVLGFYYGDPRPLQYSYDEDGNACGKDDGYEDYPFLYFYSVISDVKELNIGGIINGVCVKKCPNEAYKEEIKKIHVDCKPTKNNKDCSINYEDYFQSKGIFGKFCFPEKNEKLKSNSTFQEKIKILDSDTGKTFTKIIDVNMTRYFDGYKYIRYDAIDETDAQLNSQQLINWSFFTKGKFAMYINDLIVTRWAIFASIFWSFILSMIFILFLRVCAGVIVFLFIFGVFAGLIVLAVILRKNENNLEDYKDETYRKFMRACFWITIIVIVIWFLIVLIMCNRIRLAVSMVKITSKYILRTCCIIFVPIAFLIIMLIWIAYWVVLSVYIYSTGEFDKDGSKVIASFKWDAKIRYCWWVHLFGLIFISAVISAFADFLYSSSASIWYFTHERGLENHPILRSIKRGFRFHFGSITFGALIIAIARFIMFFFEQIKKRIESSYEKSSQSKCFKCVITCFECILSCITRLIEFINKHAYIQIAIKGTSFCTAAWEGFALVIKNLGRFSSLYLIGNTFVFLGTIIIAVCSGIIGFEIITNVEYFSKDLTSCILPVFCFVFIGFIIGVIAMSIMGISMDALMHSFLLDEEINQGQAKYFPELQKFMADER